MRLNKVLYGLRLSPRAFYNSSAEAAGVWSEERCDLDPCVFRRVGSGVKEASLIVVFYVNELIVTSREDLCKSLREHLDKSFRRRI